MDKNNLNTSINNEKQKLEDFEILKSVVNNKIEFKSLDEDVKTRLIFLCSNRLIEVNKKIENTKAEIEKVEALIKEIKN